MKNTEVLSSTSEYVCFPIEHDIYNGAIKKDIGVFSAACVVAAMTALTWSFCERVITFLCSGRV